MSRDSCASIPPPDKDWVVFGETSFRPYSMPTNLVGWLEEGPTPVDAFLQVPTNKSSRRNTVTTYVTHVLKNFSRVIGAPFERMRAYKSNSLRIVLAVCKPADSDDDTTYDISQMRVYVHAPTLQKHWDRLFTLPCCHDLFELCAQHPLEELVLNDPMVPLPQVTGVAEAKAWLLSHAAALPCFQGPSESTIVRIPYTTIAIDTTRYIVRDISTVAYINETCPCAILVGQSGVGKFAACLAAVLQRPVEKSATARTHAFGTLVVLPSGAVPWRVACIRRQMPDAVIRTLLTKADLKRCSWLQLLQADFVVVSSQLLMSKSYTEHMCSILQSLANDPETYGCILAAASAAPKPPSTTHPVPSKRRRLESLDLGLSTPTHFVPRAGTFNGLTPGIGFAAAAARRVLQESYLHWEQYREPVLEAITFSHILFVDCDKYADDRLQLLSGKLVWATSKSVPPALFVLPPSVTEALKPANQIAFAQKALALLMKSPDVKKPRLPARHHTTVPMTPREILRIDPDAADSAHVHLDPMIDTAPRGVMFVSKDAMAESVMRVAKQHLSAMQTRRDMLQSHLERENVSAFASEYPEHNDGNMLDDDDDEDYQDGNDDDNDTDDDDDDDDDGNFYVVNSGSNYIEVVANDGLSALETLMLEFSPERMQQNVDQLNEQIEDAITNETKLTERVTKSVETAIGTEACVICSVTNVNAMLGCGHTFCVGCITRWRETKATCPTCNMPSASVVALSEFDPIPCPIAGASKLWSNVWKSQTMTSQVFWIVHTLRTLERQHRRGFVVVKMSGDARPLLKVLLGHDIAIKHLSGSLQARLKIMQAFDEHRTHLLAASSDVLSGAGCNGVTDIVFANSFLKEEDIEQIRSRLHTCTAVHTYQSVPADEVTDADSGTC